VPTDDPGRDRSGQTTPGIPSFDSLRGPRRRSPVDVLTQGPADVPAEPRPSGRPAGGGRPAEPRPPEWADLLRLGIHVAGAVAAAPVRVVRWSVCAPAHRLRRLLGT
jgi:hypothetical protein